MDGQENSDLNENESTSNGQKKQETVESAKETKLNIDALEAGYKVDSNPYEPGPSRIHLPGEINQSPKPNLHTRLSKSEHSIPHVITAKDVANALKLTSMSYKNTNITPVVTNLNLNDLKIPSETKKDDKNATVTIRVESKTMVNLKNFMASSFKLPKEPACMMQPSPEVAVHKTHTRDIVMNERQNRANSSDSTVTAQRDNEVIKPKTILTKPPGIDPKTSKTSKKSGLSDISDLLLTARDSLSSIGSNVCRICMTRGRERLISPCNCKGSLANVHLSCLERWLNQVGRNHCELCGFCYPAIRTPRYTVLQALRLWFGNPRNRSHLQSDCLIFWLLSTVTAGLLAVCIVGTQYFVIEGSKFGKLDGSARKYEGISHRITETAMDFFMAIVLCGYTVTVYLLWKDHYVMWNRWRRANVNVRLLLSHDAEPVPFVPRQQRYNV